MKLDGKVAVVTGASSGMGYAISQLFVKEGANVVAVARRKERLEELAESVAAGPGRLAIFVGDVSTREANEGMLDFAIAEFGKLDILINNAGLMDDMMPVGEIEDDLWEKIQKVNVYGPMSACRSAVNIMMKQESGGNIVNIASVGGLFGSRAGIAYTASKHALIGMTKNIGFTYADKNIRCNAVCPGGVETEVGVGIQNPSELGMAKMMSGAGTMPRQGKASEIASVVLFLVSDDASFVNGTALTADAGWTAY